MIVKDILSKTLTDTYIIVNFIEHDKNIWIPPEYMDDICNSFVGDLHVDNITTDTRVIFQDDLGGMVPDRAIISYLVINAYRGKDLVPISKDKLENDLKILAIILRRKNLALSRRRNTLCSKRKLLTINNGLMKLRKNGLTLLMHTRWISSIIK